MMTIGIIHYVATGLAMNNSFTEDNVKICKRTAAIYI